MFLEHLSLLFSFRGIYSQPGKAWRNPRRNLRLHPWDHDCSLHRLENEHQRLSLPSRNGATTRPMEDRQLGFMHLPQIRSVQDRKLELVRLTPHLSISDYDTKFTWILIRNCRKSWTLSFLSFFLFLIFFLMVRLDVPQLQIVWFPIQSSLMEISSLDVSQCAVTDPQFQFKKLV